MKTQINVRGLDVNLGHKEFRHDGELQSDNGYGLRLRERR